MIEKKENISVT